MERQLRFPVFSFRGRFVHLTLSLDPEPVQALLRELGNRLEHPGEQLWTGVGAVCRQNFREKFAAGGKPRWAPLARRTRSEKGGLLRQGLIPRKTPTGKIPRRLHQQGTFDSGTILIRTGRLRDSWVQKGARGHVEEVVGSGQEFFVGSQLTIETELAPGASLKPYHILTKRALRRRADGEAVGALLPLARFHEEGTRNMPARPVAVSEDGEPLLESGDLEAIEEAALRWMQGGVALGGG